MNDTTKASLEHSANAVSETADWNRKQIASLRLELANREESLETNERELRELKASLQEGAG